RIGDASSSGGLTDEGRSTQMAAVQIMHGRENGSNKATVDLVNEHTTLRRHMGSKHKVIDCSSKSVTISPTQVSFNQGTYRCWCKSADFLSMIPEDVKARRQVNTNAKEQPQVDDHFNQANPEDRPLVYSDGLFKDVAI
ncbi:hypothetical protein EI94DRAFT_1709545, partial [Lactarius quietus]